MSAPHDWTIWSGHVGQRPASVWVSEQGACWVETDDNRQGMSKATECEALRAAIRSLRKRGVIEQPKDGVIP